MSGSGGGKPGTGLFVDDGASYSSFWDVDFNRELRIMTKVDIDKINWDDVTAEQIINAIPAGASFEVAMHILISQICRLTKKVKDLESEMTDRIILDTKKP